MKKSFLIFIGVVIVVCTSYSELYAQAQQQVDPLHGVTAAGNSIELAPLQGSSINTSQQKINGHPCNLVKNGDFELYTSCPTSSGQMVRANDWFQGTSSGGSSDFFHSTCGFMNVGGGITPVLPFPSGVGCAGVYTNNVAWNGYYKEEFAQKLDFCAGQKYRVDFYAAKPSTGSYVNILGNISLHIGNAPTFPTAAFDPVTRCMTNFTEAAFVAGNLITPAWQFFSRTFTPTVAANGFIFSGNCLGPYAATGYVFVDDIVIIPIDTMSLSTNNISTCDSAVFTITIPGGCYGPYDFTIDNGTTIDTVFGVSSGYIHSIYPAQTGTYTITSIINNYGCTTTLNLPITVTSASSANLTQNASICGGGTYTLPGGTVVSTAGTYIDTIVVAGGCDSIITTNLTIGANTASSQTASICSGNTFILPGGAVVGTAGTYIDTLKLNGGCDSIITTTLSLYPVQTSTINPTICTGQSYTLASGIVVSTAGTYLDTLATTAGCDSIITVNLSLASAITNTVSATICTGQSYQLPSGTNVIAAGIYSDTLTAQGGCDSIIATTLSVVPAITTSLSPTICAGDNFTLASGTVVSSSGTYSTTLTAANGCDSIITTVLTVNPSPVASTSGSVIIQQGQTTTLNASGGSSYAWTPSTSLNTTSGNSVLANPNQTTTYCVEVTDNNGCTDTSCLMVTVEVLPCPTNDILFLPNAFSPNADGENDEFCVQSNTQCVESFQITIYDRWGAVIFESDDPKFCWDGKHKNPQLNTEVFVYYIKANFTNTNRAVEQKGNISLLR